METMERESARLYSTSPPPQAQRKNTSQTVAEHESASVWILTRLNASVFFRLFLPVGRYHLHSEAVSASKSRESIQRPVHRL